LKNSVAKLDNGWEISFEKCLIATGGQPKSLKIFKTASNRLKSKLTLYRGVSCKFLINNCFFVSVSFHEFYTSMNFMFVINSLFSLSFFLYILFFLQLMGLVCTFRGVDALCKNKKKKRKKNVRTNRSLSKLAYIYAKTNIRERFYIYRGYK